jgi:hypothetical protein
MFVLRRKSDGKFWTDAGRHWCRSKDLKWSDDLTKARVFPSIAGARSCRGVQIPVPYWSPQTDQEWKEIYAKPEVQTERAKQYWKDHREWYGYGPAGRKVAGKRMKSFGDYFEVIPLKVSI